MSHPWATICIQVPMLEVQAPTHIRRKSRYWNALKTRPITLSFLLRLCRSLTCDFLTLDVAETDLSEIVVHSCFSGTHREGQYLMSSEGKRKRVRILTNQGLLVALTLILAAWQAGGQNATEAATPKSAVLLAPHEGDFVVRNFHFQSGETL